MEFIIIWVVTLVIKFIFIYYENGLNNFYIQLNAALNYLEESDKLKKSSTLID